MKTRVLFFLTVLLCLPAILFAQVPRKLNYQAVVRNTDSSPVVSTEVRFRFSIVIPTKGMTDFEEVHLVTTNDYGLVNVSIGEVDPVSFAELDWGSQEYGLKVECDPTGGTNYTIVETRDLASVPYALHAATAGKSLGDSLWKQSGSNIYYTDGSVGIGKSNPSSSLDITAAAISDTPENILTASVSDDPNSYLRIRNSTISDGKFMPAIIGFNGTDHRQSLFFVANTTDALDDLAGFPLITFDARREEAEIVNRPLFQWSSYGNHKMTMLANGNLGIGTTAPSGKLQVNGGFAWNDEEPLFEVKNKYGNPVFAVYNNGVEVYIDDDLTTKGPKGGFAIGGFDRTKGGTKTVDFMRITPDSIRFNINNESSKGPKGGFAIGGFDRTKGEINQDFMYITPQNSDNGEYNAFFGYHAGLSNTVNGSHNTFLGYKAGVSNTEGDYNISIGYSAGSANQDGSGNLIIGNDAAQSLNGGSSNIILGELASPGLTSGDFNIVIGHLGGSNLVAGNNNIFIGNLSGLDYSNVSNELRICQSSNLFNPSIPLISGDLINNKVVINGYLGQNTQGRAFFSNGSAGGTTVWYNDSDLRKKKNINQIVNALEKVLMLRGVQFEWKDISNHSPGRQVGFIAQEVAEIVPEVVDNSNDSYSMSYAPLTALLVEAVKEQQSQIVNQQKDIENLQTQIALLQQMVMEMAAREE